VLSFIRVPVDGGSTSLQKVYAHLKEHMRPHPTRVFAGSLKSLFS